MLEPRIEPFTGLQALDERYTSPPKDPAVHLAGQVATGLAPILWVAHAGQGKSTQLCRLQAELQASGPVILLDLADITGGVIAERVLYEIAQATVQWWVQDGPEAQPSPFLVQDLRASNPSFPQGQGRTLPPSEIGLAAWDELTGAVQRDRVPLLIDGVDRLPPDVARQVLQQLLVLEPRASLVVLGTPELATGVQNLGTVDRYRVVTLDPHDPASPPDLAFLVAVARAHLGVEGAESLSDAMAQRVAEASGGVLRDLLALTGDAWAYGSDGIDNGSIDRAIVDRSERYRRLILDGDRAILAAAEGTTGLEVPAERKVRLLQHGLLLETGLGVDARVRVHPMVRAFETLDGA